MCSTVGETYMKVRSPITILSLRIRDIVINQKTSQPTQKHVSFSPLVFLRHAHPHPYLNNTGNTRIEIGFSFPEIKETTITEYRI